MEVIVGCLCLRVLSCYVQKHLPIIRYCDVCSCLHVKQCFTQSWMHIEPSQRLYGMLHKCIRVSIDALSMDGMGE